jgi:hypothetical protein
MGGILGQKLENRKWKMEWVNEKKEGRRFESPPFRG